MDGKNKPHKAVRSAAKQNVPNNNPGYSGNSGRRASGNHKVTTGASTNTTSNSKR